MCVYKGMGRKIALLALVSLALTGCADGGHSGEGGGGRGSGGTPGASEPAPDVVGEWVLAEGSDAEGSLRNLGTPVTLVLTDESTVAGMAPCNSYAGDYALTAASLSFTAVTRTEVACSSLSVESRYFAALERVDHVERSGETLTLTGDDVTLSFSLLAKLSVD
ncbi:MAG: uncharacterized protein JWM51_2059 [Microbacteriaceae bacterium]|nr:uncharacterized protein [Microbacteriaceae bacterium]